VSNPWVADIRLAIAKRSYRQGAPLIGIVFATLLGYWLAPSVKRRIRRAQS
jgi:hypothetical protein